MMFIESIIVDKACTFPNFKTNISADEHFVVQVL